MNRRTVFSRILGAVGFAATAKALPYCPEDGQAVPVGEPHIKPPEPVQGEPWPTTSWREMEMLDVKKRIVIRSRIHEQDIAKEILRTEAYEHIRLPIVIDDPGHNPPSSAVVREWWNEVQFGRNTDRIHWTKLGNKA